MQSAFEDVLKTLDAMEREPDQAEELNLVDALCSMANGQYVWAARKIVETRGLVASKAIGVDDTQPRVTKDMMRRGLIHLRIHR